MRDGVIIVLAISAVLYGAPPSAFATGTADATMGPVAIAIGIGGIAAMALFAWLVPLALRRRRRREPRWLDALADEPSRPTTTEEHVTAALHRRTLRRAHVRLDEDPIIASMGVGTAASAEPGVRRARRTVRRSPPT